MRLVSNGKVCTPSVAPPRLQRCDTASGAAAAAKMLAPTGVSDLATSTTAASLCPSSVSRKE